MKSKSALSYFGSDSEVADKLAALMEHCKHVTIPFVGGGSIIPFLSARGVVANDMNEAAINFYRVVSGWYGDKTRDELISRCSTTLNHPGNMHLAEEQLAIAIDDPMELAWSYWVVCWVGRKGKGGTVSEGGTPSVRWTADGGNNASRIATAANDLQEWGKHLKRCEWTCLDFRECIGRCNDRIDCGIYCDPPWPDLGKEYKFSMSNADHRDLKTLLEGFEKLTVVLRYGDHPLIRELYCMPRWKVIKAASRTQSNAVKGELWITNRVHA